MIHRGVNDRDRSLKFGFGHCRDRLYKLLTGCSVRIAALFDWAYGRFRPHAASNLWRTVTGVLLGMALGRTLYVHLQKPLPTIPAHTRARSRRTCV